ncbi:hypothetical protein F5X68DRAFT_253779 [Plectosphaerella plurivora]|uniref:Ubiquitin-like domain-containing protein n=1 Tax=Plectosphaerella plurivora TaxID=936078 RepID=A0A9P9ACE2_9PEZI|nr:hypothetical protein F5X68DRAFT_253779 [Plectosphaerella plurivora]
MEKIKRFIPRFKSRNRDNLTATGSDESNNGPKSPAPAASVSVNSSLPKKKSEPRPAHVYEEEPHGLFILHPPPEVGANAEGFQVDIVAVHGLNGTARATWRDAASGKFWLQDFLPLTMPSARVMTYGYDSGLAFSRSTAGIENFAQDLLNRLRMTRTTRHEKNRPLIFVAHSLGGIVVKKALILASEAKPVYGHILTSTIGIVFMGTPHQGSDLVPWAMMVSYIANAAFVGQAVRTDLIAALKTGSPILADISGAFIPHSKPLKIMSFVETQIERPLPALVVPEHSARMNLPNEIVFPVNANHRSICRYPSVRNQTYVLVEGAIKEVVASLEGGPRSEFEIASLKAREPPFQRTTSAQSAPVSSHTTPVNPAASKTANMVFIRVSGLVRHLLSNKEGPRRFTTIVQIPADTPVDDFKSHILLAEPDTMPNFERLRWPGGIWCDFSTWVDIFTAAATVTSGRPCYDAAQGYKIHRDQTIASFFSRAFPSPVQVQLHKRVSHLDVIPTSSYAIAFGQRKSHDGQISLLRSFRVPEDGKRYDIPQSLGTLPVYDVRSFSGDLPVAVASKGGIFVTMHNEEAMVLSFDSLPTKKYAIRPFLGGINGVSGVSMFETAQAKSANKKQDYIVVPDQDRLDGIAASPGQVRQFVTTPSASQPADPALANRKRKSRFLDFSSASASNKSHVPTGASVERQMTGEDKMGGIQLQIIPQYDIKNMHAGTVPNVILNDDSSEEYYEREEDRQRRPPVVDESAVRLDVLQTPQELGFQDDSVIHIKDLSTRLHSRKRVVRDLFDDPKANMMSNGILDLEVDDYSSKGNVTINVRKQGSKTGQEFTFEYDDEIDHINTYLQQALQVKGSLHVAFPVDNDPNFCAEIRTWQGITTFALARRQETINTIAPRVMDVRIAELDFVFGSSFQPDQPPRRVCCFVKDVEDHLLRQRYFFAMGLDAVALDLCFEIERLHPDLIPLALFHRRGYIGHHIRGPEKLFDKVSKGDIPVFEILHNHADMQVNVRTMQGSTIKFNVASEFTIANLKMRWQERQGIPEDQQRWIYAGRQLEDDRTLGDYNIGPGAHLHFVLRLRGGGPRVYLLGLGLKVPIGVTYDLDIATAKEVFSEESGIEASRLIITFKGVEMLDYESLFDYMEKTLYVTLRPKKPQVLAIGAGGTIAQTIKPDPTDKRCWDLANSKIVNIQILNASEFKSMTGYEPPISPLHESKLAPAKPRPFRMEQVMIVPSAEGAFDLVKSVDAWRQEEEEDAESDEDVKGYGEDGWRVDSGVVVTMDVDDAFVGLSI